MFTGVILLLASGVTFLLYDRHRILSTRTSSRSISVQWLPTGHYFQDLGVCPLANPSLASQRLPVDSWGDLMLYNTASTCLLCSNQFN